MDWLIFEKEKLVLKELKEKLVLPVPPVPLARMVWMERLEQLV
jgi:hypothetical protein